MDYQKFYNGDTFDAYKHLGAHSNGEECIFRVYAPAAKNVQIIGDFNSWEGQSMYKIHDGRFWELKVIGAKPGMMYKIRVFEKNGRVIDHCDPYGRRMELRPKNASIIVPENDFTFTDKKWMRNRSVRIERAFNIYEMHFGSWRMKSDKKADWYRYDELAPMIIPYLKENGYNYIEIMPLSEHPSDESWGYQNTGFYAPTARYGEPYQLKQFINECHNNDIGVIMDFVPVHFAVDDYGLWHFDGTPLYEYDTSDVGVSEWGSNNFGHHKGEVRSFLQSNANYWLTEFHFDGLRMDAVSNLIYWQGNKGRGQNPNSINFLKNMNSGLKALHPDAILIAEDSSDYQGVSRPVWEGGLGFDYKWDLGWMNDTLKYFKLPEFYRRGSETLLNFSMMYYYTENFILPFSHDEVVHGKATIAQKMDGDYEAKWPQVRALYAYMYAHPGKKLNFMGNEIGQLREWDESREQDWDMLKYPKHDEFHRYMVHLNNVYLNTPAFWEKDYDPSGFEWKHSSSEPCTFAFERRGKKQRLLCVFNFSNIDVEDYVVDEYNVSKLKEIINTTPFGTDVEPVVEKNKATVHITLRANSGRIFEIVEPRVRKTSTTKKTETTEKKTTRTRKTKKTEE